jgi:beta-phosphoglucomutase
VIGKMKLAIFDLDGVLVDTAKYHYLAWKRLANEYGFDFTEADNERLKGVSRMRSLEILLEIGGLNVDEATQEAMAAQKNAWYVEYISRLDESELLPGAADYVRHLRSRGVMTAIGSASKNTAMILERLGIAGLFDVVIDGTKTKKAKPDPEVFTLAAQSLGIDPQDCVVFEDAVAGIQAAHRGGMGVVGIGKPDKLGEADAIVPGLAQLMALSAAQV